MADDRDYAEEARLTGKIKAHGPRQSGPPSDMVGIEVEQLTADVDEMASLLRFIADQLDQGFTSGYEPTWSLDGAE